MLLEPSNFCCPPAKPGVYLEEINKPIPVNGKYSGTYCGMQGV